MTASEVNYQGIRAVLQPERGSPRTAAGPETAARPGAAGASLQSAGVFELYVSLCYNDFTGENVIANSAGVFQL